MSKVITNIIVIIICMTAVLGFHSDDEVSNLPDYPFQGRLHSGYLTLADQRKKLHYILVESSSDPTNDPLVLWLNGGPGCSSLGGFSQEHGPALFKAGTAEFVTNPYSWNQKANVIYLESPAGVGFSYIETDEDDDYKTDDTKSGKENLEALIDFFRKFPDLKKNEFFITGESYAGIYIPYLATNILNYNKLPNREFKINLKGILVGNGVTDWKVDAEAAMVEYGFNHALFGVDLYESYLKNCFKEPDQASCDADTNEIMGLIGQVNVYAIYDTCYSPSKNLTTQNKFRYTPWLFSNHRNRKEIEHLFLQSRHILKDSPPCLDDIGFNTFYNRKDVREALHVKVDLPPFQVCSDRVSSLYTIDRERGSYYLYPDLIKSGIRIFKFSGDTDSVVPFNGTEKWIKHLGLKTIAKWRSWNIGDRLNIGGFVTKYDGLTFVTVRGAGHMVPQYRPKEAFHMFNKFLTGEDL